MEPYSCAHGGMYSKVMDYSVIGFRGTRVFKNNDLPDTPNRPGGGGNLKPKENGSLDLSTKVGNDPLFSESVEGDIRMDLQHHYKRKPVLPWYIPD
jgi:hypothetical protein